LGFLLAFGETFGVVLGVAASLAYSPRRSRVGAAGTGAH
jgi:hypothetical protein